MEPELIGYLAFGYPSIEESFQRAALYLDGGIEILEVVIPAQNPFLDNEYIQMTMREALKANDCLDDYLDGIKKLIELFPKAKIIILSYETEIIRLGKERFIHWMKTNQISDTILVGGKNLSLAKELMEQDIHISSWIPFHLPEDAMERAQNSNGFIYLQYKPTGQFRPGCETLKNCIVYLRSRGINNPIYCGTGISRRDDIVNIAEAGGTAAFIGSALLKLRSEEEIINYIKSLKGEKSLC